MKKSEAQQLLEILTSGERYYDRGWRDLDYVGAERDGFTVVDRIEGENRRWSRNVAMVAEAPSGKFYRWNYDETLTENGDSEFYDELPYEVLKQERIVVKTDWTRVDE